MAAVEFDLRLFRGLATGASAHVGGRRDRQGDEIPLRHFIGGLKEQQIKQHELLLTLSRAGIRMADLAIGRASIEAQHALM